MEEVYFATTNKGKFTYLSQRFGEFGLKLSHAQMELPEPRSEDLKIIAKEKVLHAYRQLGRPCIAVDAGFYVHSLNGFPKAFTNFALSTIGVEGILSLAKGKPRNCEFRNCVAYMDSSLGEPMLFESGIRGMLSESRQGSLSDIDWSELSLVFIPEGESKTLGEMTNEERNHLVSQRWGPSYKEVAEWVKAKK